MYNTFSGNIQWSFTCVVCGVEHIGKKFLCMGMDDIIPLDKPPDDWNCVNGWWHCPAHEVTIENVEKPTT